ncbi:MAG TPA: hypothetical protein H9838_09100, partial [Candidatus Acutalibacter pullistercoris]|nr:hypothetical protein [Candidatus Acutalibacter pullistercoris]
FSNVGLNLGIARLAPYAEYFGLGTTTGVEIGESTGTMSNPQEYRENHGVNWTDGVSAQTAIGQADNMFTPIQLATMCATMANDGVRLKTHLLDRITDYEGEEVLEQHQPEELYDAEISSDVAGVVREAMIQCATSGTARSVFGDYPVAVAAKTGTAETSSVPDTDPDYTEPNLSFICYAPANDPEIAVAVMMEHGNTGDYAKYVAKDILDQYFGYYTWDEEGNKYDQEGNQVDDDGEILVPAEDLQEEDEDSSAPEAEEPGEETEEPRPTPTPEPTPTPNSPYYDPAEEPPDPTPGPEGSPPPGEDPGGSG